MLYKHRKVVLVGVNMLNEMPLNVFHLVGCFGKVLGKVVIWLRLNLARGNDQNYRNRILHCVYAVGAKKRESCSKRRENGRV